MADDKEEEPGHTHQAGEVSRGQSGLGEGGRGGHRQRDGGLIKGVLVTS